MRKISPLQQTIWLTQNIYAKSSLFNVGGYASIEGELDVPVLVRSIESLLDSVDVIEIGYYAFNDLNLQDNSEFKKYDVMYIDISMDNDAAAVCLDWIHKDMNEKFDVTRNLLKVRVFKASQNSYFWYIKVHHLVFDGYSMSLFFNTVATLYSESIAERAQKMASDSYNYSDFIESEEQYRYSETYKEDNDFWFSRLDNATASRAFESCFKSASKESLASKRKEITIDREIYNQIDGFCKELNCTVFHYFIATLFILNRSYNNEAAVIGLPVFNRRNRKFKNTLGTFVNMLPFSISIEDGFTFTELLVLVKNELKTCYKHGRFPLYDALKELDRSGNIYNITFSYQKNSYDQRLGNLAAAIHYIHSGEQQEDLAFHLLEYDEQEDLKFSIDYAEELFSDHMIGGFLNHFSSLLKNILSSPGHLITQFDFLQPEEKAELITGFNDTAADYPKEKTLVMLFEEQVAKNPDAVALVFEDTTLTYRELNERSNQLAHYLRTNYQVVADDLIVVCLQRSEKLMISILGILKSGGAYVPVDPEFPQDRIDYLVADSNCKVILDKEFFDTVSVESYSKENPEVISGPGDLAYVLYTSGTTGRPKGCMLEHRGVVNRIEWMWDHYGFDATDVILQKTTFTFDVSVWEIFMPFCWGTKMVLCSKDDTVSPERLLGLIVKHGVTCLHFVPSMLSAFLSSVSAAGGAGLSGLRRVMCSGEALPAETVKRWYELTNVALHNLYGPTEASVDVSYYATDRDDTKIPIGRPIWNTQLYVLGSAGQVVPVGVTGEICISGDGLARGYLNRPELSAEKFVANPFRTGERMYLTGDLGRWLADGNIEYLGRKDDQVKIRGYRIELGEIENSLSSCAGVDSAVVLATDNGSGEKELTAYLTGTAGLDVQEIRAHLGKSLPSYMLPSHYIQLDELPLNASGKADRRALSALAGKSLSTGVEYVAAGNETEAALVQIWEEILGREKISVLDNFFELGGHSLKAMRLSSRLNKELGVNISLKDLFANPVLADQAVLAGSQGYIGYKGIPVAVRQADYPLSSAQRRLWVLSQFEEGNMAYNMSGVFEFEGKLDTEVLEHSFLELISRHESLRTIFKENTAGEIRQFIPAGSSFKLSLHDLTDSAAAEEFLNAGIRYDTECPFELIEGPLLRAGLYRLSAERWVFTFTMHHIISDGWSMGIIMKELFTCYEAGLKGTAAVLPELPIQYKDYAVWQQENLQEGSQEEDKAYWLSRFSGSLPVLDLPADHPRPVIKTYHGDTVYQQLGSELTAGLKGLLKESGVTLFMGLLSAVNVLLHRYSGQEDIITGSVVSGRDHGDLEDQIGFYVNTLALRTIIKGEDNYREVLENIKSVTIEAYMHQSYPFDELVNDLNLSVDMSRNALFDVMVLLQEDGGLTSGLQLEGVQVNTHEDYRSAISKFDLSFNFVEKDGGIEAAIEYNSDIYGSASIARLGRHLEQLLRSMVAAPDTAIGSILYLNEEEKVELISGFNDTAADYPKEKTLVMLFEEQVAKNPDAVALVFEDTTLTYRELNERSNQLAHYLRTNYQVVADDLIAVCLQRSETLMISILGILKSGGAYVPIDPEFPQDRIDYLAADSNCKVMINRSFFDYTEVSLYSKENPEVISGPGDLAYVLYTSGTTGRPKGCMLEHRGVVNRIEWMWEHYGFDATDVILQKTTFTFDVSVWEIFMPFCWGTKMVLCSKDDTVSPERLFGLIVKHGVTCLHFVPSMLSAFLASVSSVGGAGLSGLRRVMCSGEALPADTVKRWYELSNVALHNLYGPTEASVDVSYYATDRDDTKIPIGRPIWNTQLYVLGFENQVVPVGVTGEICISGDGLARGYLNRPELSAEKFVANPFRPGERMYLTGDLGKWLADGNIEYLGRKDDQVKIRGYRIELGEIENTLSSCAGVDSAVVLATGNGEKELTAYLTGTAGLDVQEIRAHLGKSLPSYMLPSQYIQLDTLPLNASGKADRRALSLLAGTALSTGIEYVAPRNETETALVQIWEEILGREKIGVLDNFFELGGHSLKAMRLSSRLNKELGVSISLKDLFIHPILADQAVLANSQGYIGYKGIPVAVRQADYPLSSAQRRLWVLSQFEEGNTAYNMSGVFEFEGELDTEVLEHSFLELISRHESLRTVFKENAAGEIRQFIPAGSSFKLSLHDLTDSAAAGEFLSAGIRYDMQCPFELTEGPLLRAGLYRLSPDHWMFTFTMHHIISDGWSMGILMKELLTCYDAGLKGTAAVLPVLWIQYKDYAVWQQTSMQESSQEENKAYWLSRFSGSLPVLDLPADHPRPVIKTYNGNTIYQQLGPELTAGLKGLLKENGATLFMGLLSAVNVLLYCYSGQEDIITGSAVSGRDHSDLEDQIGFYVNTLALRAVFEGDDSYRKVLENIKSVTIDAYAHQAYPFDELVSELDLSVDMSRNALFDVMVLLQEDGGIISGLQLEGVQVSAHEGYRSEVSKFDLSFNFVEKNGGIEAGIEYNSDIYKAERIARLGRHLEQLLGSMVAAPDAAIGSLSYLKEEEKAELITGFNNTALDYLKEKTMIDLFQEQVIKNPDAVALVAEDTTLTYHELNERANQFANYLRTNYQVSPDDLVGIKLERNEWLIIAMLGILKSGAAYVPVDPEYPQERIDYMIADSACRLLIETSVLADFRAAEEKYDKENLAKVNNPADLAYVIYTSGSTGKPKGVMVGHQNVTAFLDWCKGEFSASVFDVVFGVTSVCFDLSVFEIFYTLTAGKRLRLLPNALSINDYLLTENNILLNTVPGVVGTLLAEGADLSHVNVLNMAGEPIPSGYIPRLDYRRMEVRNLYGPSEDTTYSTVYRIQQEDTILIGRPISNTQVYILGAAGQVVPIGVTGEICISGDGLARGYLNRPELSAEKFVPNPFRTGERMYLTGDLGRWLADGNIEYLGRKDDQVKIRGYRIELGEIESRLSSCAGVESAVVLATGNGSGEKELTAYLAGNAGLDVQEIRAHLGKSLPSYMLPSHYIQLDTLPLNANGKTDKRALSLLAGTALSTGVEYVAARNETESALVQIWEEILGREKISVQDNFFELGGHSLKAMRLSSRLNKELGVNISLKDLFMHPVLADQAVLAGSHGYVGYKGIPVAVHQADYPLSSAQRRLWVLSQFEEGNTAYNMSGVFEFAGKLDTEVLEHSFLELISRHEALRTVFRANTAGEIRQFIPEGSLFRLNCHDLRDSATAEEFLNAGIRYDTEYPFGLAEGPLLRAGLYRLSAERWVFTCTMHHIISDGWSMGILMKELFTCYEAGLRGTAAVLPELSIQYKDYAVWQQENLQKGGQEEDKAYWLSRFSGSLPVLDLPADRPRPVIKTYRGDLVYQQLGSALTAGLKGLLKESGATLFMGLLSAVNVLLHRYSGQEDIIIGSAVSGRDHGDLEDQIGFYVNTLALRAIIKGEDNYREVLENIKTVTIEGYAHQSYPFDELVNDLNLSVDMSRNALFDVMVLLQEDGGITSGLQLEGVQVNEYRGSRSAISKFDLSFNFVEKDGGITAEIEYNSDIYGSASIARLGRHLEQLLTSMVAAPDTAIGSVLYLDEEEKAELITGFNDTAADYPEEKTLVMLFEEQVAKNPDAVVLVFEDTTLTYRELNERSNQLAHYLRTNYQVVADDLIAVCLQRSEKLMISILGILKSGGAYVPVDPEFPQDRIDYLVADSNCKVILDKEFFDTVSVESYSKENPELISSPGDLAYVLYTSGTTGRPKGCMLEHRGVVNRIEWMWDHYGFDATDVILQKTTFTFDVSVWEIFMPFCWGTKMVLCSKDDTVSPERLLGLIVKHGVTCLHFVPSMLSAFLASLSAAGGAGLSGLRRVMCSGEALPAETVKRWYELTNVALHNLYGPTEASVDVSYYATDRDDTKIPIGRPIWNTQLYVLGLENQVVPVGVTGEICISGDGLARGYLNRPELSAEKFVANPFRPGERMYLTGDLGRWLADGNIEYLGRKDDQVKIRGYRIELGEIENSLSSCAGVESAVVLATDNGIGEKELTAYLTGTAGLDVQEIRAHLGKSLPSYMLPSHYIQLDELPLNASGKADRRALSLLEGTALSTGIEYVAPRNETEAALVQIWEEILGREKIGVLDNFFELGGHSLKGIQLISRINTAFLVQVNIQSIFRTPTIESLAEQIVFILDQEKKKENKENLLQIEI